MARGGEAQRRPGRDDGHVQTSYVDGVTIRPLRDGDTASIAALFARDGSGAEIAFAVADVYQGRGVGTVLTRELAGVARGAGITSVRATVSGDNPAAVSLLARCARSLQVSWRGGQREFVVGL
jgi:GNAT superfamily N-acetyltransferase